MKVLINLAALSALTILLTGCFNGSSGGGGGDRPDPAVDFSTFVKIFPTPIFLLNCQSRH